MTYLIFLTYIACECQRNACSLTCNESYHKKINLKSYSTADCTVSDINSCHFQNSTTFYINVLNSVIADFKLFTFSYAVIQLIKLSSQLLKEFSFLEASIDLAQCQSWLKHQFYSKCQSTSLTVFKIVTESALWSHRETLSWF